MTVLFLLAAQPCWSAISLYRLALTSRTLERQDLRQLKLISNADINNKSRKDESCSDASPDLFQCTSIGSRKPNRATIDRHHCILNEHLTSEYPPSNASSHRYLNPHHPLPRHRSLPPASWRPSQYTSAQIHPQFQLSLPTTTKTTRCRRHGTYLMKSHLMSTHSALLCSLLLCCRQLCWSLLLSLQ
jgi:hypothetical protein